MEEIMNDKFYLNIIFSYIFGFGHNPDAYSPKTIMYYKNICLVNKKWNRMINIPIIKICVYQCKLHKIVSDINEDLKNITKLDS